MLKIVECPRDAMQGFDTHIPTTTKVEYLNQLLKVGFDTLDFGSFVSPKAVPQMADTEAVLESLDWEGSNTRLLAIVANERGAQDALRFSAIDYLGYPFSLSETFQQRNTNRSMIESMALVSDIHNLCQANGKKLVVYLSMAFGNPYGDHWEPALAEEWLSKMVQMGIQTIALADTVGTANQETIHAMFSSILPRFPEVEIGAHLHANPENALEKIAAAYDAGCRRFDVAMQGFGGCPFAKDELTGNIASETLVSFCQARSLATNLDQFAFQEASTLAQKVFQHN